MTNQIYPTTGRWCTSQIFVPWFAETKKQFKATTDEDYKAKAQEPTSGTGTETQSGVAPEDPQAAASKT